jgi:hypothetical protein
VGMEAPLVATEEKVEMAARAPPKTSTSPKT